MFQKAIASDIDIAHEATMLPIGQVAQRLGLSDDDLEHHGKYKAKIAFEVLDRLVAALRPDGVLLVPPLADDQALLSDREAHHEFQCNDGSLLHAAYRDEGLVMILSGPAQPQPIRLTAPAQGLTYVGEGITATITNRVLRISETDRPERTCTSGKPLGLSPVELADDLVRDENRSSDARNFVENHSR